MPQYYYTAKSKEKKGEITDLEKAADKSELARKLKERDLFLIEAKEIKSKNFLPFGGKVSLEDKIFFTRNLQMMLSGGLSLSRSLRTISLQTKNEHLRSVLLEVREEVHKGTSFSEALEIHSDVFSDLFISIIKLSEKTGRIEENLNILINQFKKEYQLKSEVKGSLMYPFVIIFAMVLVGVAMLILVVPKLAQTFNSMQMDLPITTRFFIALGSFLANSWYLIPVIIAIFFAAIKTAANTEKGKKLIDSLLFKLPVVSSVIIKINSARIARTLHSLLSSGISIVDSLEIISENTSNIYFKEAMKEAKISIKKGDNLSESLKPHSDIFSFLLIQMIEVGEETGKTSEVLDETAEFLEEEVFSSLKNLTSIIEPALMIIVGVAVGFFAFSMLMPMYSLLEVL
ncbi:MAG: type II secretion system F family protein [Patescibacteria group bacterium]